MKFLKIKPFFGSPDQGALKTVCPDSRMFFSGIPNSQHCGRLLAFVMIAAVLSHYWPLLCKVRRRALYFILKNCFTINKKFLNHAKLALQRANNPVVNARNCSEALNN